MIESCTLEAEDSNHQTGDSKEQPLAAPLFTIITDCKNSSTTIDDCLASVAAQDIGGVEHVVVDRHSQDDTVERVYAHRHRLSIVYGSANDTRFQAWNRGIGHASGDILGFLDGTDALANPHVLRRVAEAFQDPKISAVYGDVLCVDARDIDHVMIHHYVGPVSRKRLSRGWVPPTTALFVRKSWYQRINGFSPTMKSAADYEASLRLFSYPFFNAAYLGVPVIKQRLTAPSIRQLRGVFGSPGEELRALRSTRVGGWQALAWRSLARIGHWL